MANPEGGDMEHWSPFTQIDHPREHTLIFEQILSTNSLRKCIEISLENFYVVTEA